VIGNNNSGINFKAIVFGGLLAILIFSLFYSVEKWALTLQGTELNHPWIVSETQYSDPFSEKEDQTAKDIPFHALTETSVYVNCQYTFDDTYRYLVLPFVSSSGFRVYLNGVMIQQTGDLENGTANVWNHVHLITLDDSLLKEKDNELLLELYALYTYGIDKAPVLSNAEDIFIKVYIMNLFRTYIPFISMGAALILGIILIVLGISDKNTRRLFFHLGFCMLLTAGFLFDDRFRISSGSVETFLFLRKLSVSSGFLASWFLAAAMEIYTTKKLRISNLLLIVNLITLFFGLIQPTFYDYATWVNHSLILNIINIFTASIILLLHLKEREWLFLPIFFMNLTFIHYLITWHILRSLGPNLSNLGLIFGSIGFGLILIVQFRRLLKKNILMEQTNFELEIQKNEALKTAEMKSDIIAQTSHEIRNPLMGILGMSESLLSKQLDEETLDDISVIKSCSLKMNEILNNILDNAKIEAGKFELHEEIFSIGEIIHELDAIYSVLTKQKNLLWSVNIDQNVPEKVFTDKIRITQILNNLLSNAVKYTDHGGVSLIISTTDDNLIFIVKDTGSGIKKELQEKIFDPYYQLENSFLVQGTGLGLSIVKKIIKIFNGKLLLKSEEGEGSEFQVSIPYNTKLNPSREENHLKNNVMKILLADDNRINIRVLKNYLKEYSEIKISVAYDGKEALSNLMEEDFDYVIMDLNMPFASGTEILQRIKNSESRNKSAYFIALTGEPTNEISDYLRKTGFDEVIRKPVSKNTFLNIFSRDYLSTSASKAKAEGIIINRIKSAGLDTDTAVLIIDEFLKETPYHFSLLEEAVKNMDYQKIYEKAHYFKSSLDYLGTEKASNLQKLIEEAAKIQDSGSITLYFKEFLLEIQNIERLLREFSEDKEAFIGTYES